MPNEIKDWSTTPADNASSDSGINWAEGQPPSTVNNSARGMMSAIKKWWDEQLGGTDHYASDSGLADAYAIAPSPIITGYVAGQVYFFFAANANTGTSTLAVNGLTAQAIQKNGIALEGGEIGSGDLVTVIYDGTQFQLLNNPRFNQFKSLTVDGDVTLDGNLTLKSDVMDEDGNEWIGYSATVSATNHTQVSNAATGSSPAISAVGDDANIDLTIAAKGTGLINLTAGLKLTGNLFDASGNEWNRLQRNCKCGQLSSNRWSDHQSGPNSLCSRRRYRCGSQSHTQRNRVSCTEWFASSDNASL